MHAHVHVHVCMVGAPSVSIEDAQHLGEVNYGQQLRSVAPVPHTRELVRGRQQDDDLRSVDGSPKGVYDLLVVGEAKGCRWIT